uniref:Uncharacterized protein n=2 Tax=Anguilla anguilla TaxID=7936 RepID=A0A0E9RHJ9_ANGAN
MVILLIATSAVVLVCSIPLVVSLHSSSFMCFAMVVYHYIFNQYKTFNYLYEA